MMTAAIVLATLLLWEGAARPLLAKPAAELRAVLEIWRIRRQARTRLERDMAAIAALKAKILSVGEIEQHPGGGITLHGNWQFDCSNGAMVHRVDAHGVQFYCGYSDKELVEIWKRRDEFANRDRR